MANLVPCEWAPGQFMQEEMDARGWSLEDLHVAIGPTFSGKRHLCVDLILYIHDRNLILDKYTAKAIAHAFGTSPEFWLNLDAAWREQPAEKRDGVEK